MRIAEIAKRAKVSPATVSRVINQPHLVSPERLKTVQTVMEHVNYVPAPIGRRRGPKSRMSPPKKIGVWFVGAKKSPNLNWFQEQLVQIQPTSDRYRIDLSVLFTDRPDELPRAIGAAQLDGVIIQGLEPAGECMARLESLPHVWFMTRRSTAYPGDYVEPDNDANGALAADYLRGRGHKKVAVLTTAPDYSAISWRSAAFCARARALGLEVETLYGKPSPGVGYLQPQPMAEEIEPLVRRFLASAPHPTGLYLPADHFCGTLFRALRQGGLKPGHDFEAVLGNYTPVIYQNLEYQPAAIDIHLQTLVRKVVEHLVWRIENPAAPGRVGVTVSPTLLPAEQARVNHAA